MTAPILIWLLVATSGSSASSPSVIERFTDKRECENAAYQPYTISKDRTGMAFIHGACVSVDPRKIYSPKP